MSRAAPATFGQTSSQAAEERTYRKVRLRIVPFLLLCSLAAYFDRVNVGFAKLQMLRELNLGARNGIVSSDEQPLPAAKAAGIAERIEDPAG